MSGVAEGMSGVELCSGFKGLASNTALPVLHSATLENHDKIIEFGAGLASTPFLYRRVRKKLVTVETDREWLKKAAKDVGVQKESGKEFVGIHDGRWDRDHDPTKEEIKEYIAYCRRLCTLHGPFDLAYVDQIVHFRKYTLMALIGNIPIIVFHDTECDAYGYDPLVSEVMADNARRSERWSYRSFMVWTDIIVPNTYDFKSFDLAVDEFARANVSKMPYIHRIVKL